MRARFRGSWRLTKFVKQNVLVNAAGCACLSDMGFAAPMCDEELEVGSANKLTRASQWTAPEVFKNGQFSKQSDVFSLGFVAVEVSSQMLHFLYPRLTMRRYSQESYYGEGLTQRRRGPRLPMASAPVCPRGRRNSVQPRRCGGCWPSAGKQRQQSASRFRLC